MPSAQQNNNISLSKISEQNVAAKSCSSDVFNKDVLVNVDTDGVHAVEIEQTKKWNERSCFDTEISDNLNSCGNTQIRDSLLSVTQKLSTSSDDFNFENAAISLSLNEAVNFVNCSPNVQHQQLSPAVTTLSAQNNQDLISASQNLQHVSTNISNSNNINKSLNSNCSDFNDFASATLCSTTDYLTTPKRDVTLRTGVFNTSISLDKKSTLSNSCEKDLSLKETDIVLSNSVEERSRPVPRYRSPQCTLGMSFYFIFNATI